MLFTLIERIARADCPRFAPFVSLGGLSRLRCAYWFNYRHQSHRRYRAGQQISRLRESNPKSNSSNPLVQAGLRYDTDLDAAPRQRTSDRGCSFLATNDNQPDGASVRFPPRVPCSRHKSAHRRVRCRRTTTEAVSSQDTPGATELGSGSLTVCCGDTTAPATDPPRSPHRPPAPAVRPTPLPFAAGRDVFRDASMPTKWQPCSSAATPTCAEPQSGSSTVPPMGQPIKTQFFAVYTGIGAGWRPQP